MTYQFLGIPEYVAPEVYEKTIDKIVDSLKGEDSIRSIYRLGNVNHPGISDIDIVVLFKDGNKCSLNPVEFLNADDKYLVTHELFGASEDQFRKVIQYSFWDNLKCIWGEPIELGPDQLVLSNKEEVFYKRQVGLEFLQKNYIELSVQKKYGVIKLRSLIQEIKGVRYDLDFLNIQNLAINKCMDHFLDRLDNWFEESFNPKEFSQWLDQYHKALEEAIIYVNEKDKVLWVPREGDLTYGRNIVLKKGEQLQCKTEGTFFPAILLSKNKRVYNAHQRLNRFEITMKYSSEDADGLNLKRFKAFEIHKLENRECFPHFGALMTSLASQFIP
ncbi:MAG: hypothetical protein JKY48_19640 [Flavobacteriales bacterium]|nr:hypothetical protein [Flavobacteriales bacterium]